MMRALETLGWHLERLGRIGALGAMLAAAALIVEIALVRPMQAERAELAQASQQARLARAAQDSAAESRREGEALPLSPAAESALRQLFDAAEEEGLSLEQGDYKLVSAVAADGHRRYQLTLPVIGSYPAIRAFLARSLNDDRALALNAVELRREAVEESELEAILRFTLYLGPDA